MDELPSAGFMSSASHPQKVISLSSTGPRSQRLTSLAENRTIKSMLWTHYAGGEDDIWHCALKDLYAEANQEAYVFGPFGLQYVSGPAQSEARETGSKTYGTVMPASMIRLLGRTRFSLDPSDTFLDLGSGIGHVVLAVYLFTKVGRAVGIELLSERHEIAVKVGEVLSDSTHSVMGNRSLEFKLGSFMDFDDIHQATVVYTASLCFPPDLMHDLRRFIAERMQPGTLVLTLQKFAPCHSGLLYLREESVQTSWAKHSAVYVYALSPFPLRSASVMWPQWTGLGSGGDEDLRHSVCRRAWDLLGPQRLREEFSRFLQAGSSVLSVEQMQVVLSGEEGVQVPTVAKRLMATMGEPSGTSEGSFLQLHGARLYGECESSLNCFLTSLIQGSSSKAAGDSFGFTASVQNANEADLLPDAWLDVLMTLAGVQGNFMAIGSRLAKITLTGYLGGPQGIKAFDSFVTSGHEAALVGARSVQRLRKFLNSTEAASLRDCLPPDSLSRRVSFQNGSIRDSNVLASARHAAVIFLGDFDCRSADCQAGIASLLNSLRPNAWVLGFEDLGQISKKVHLEDIKVLPSAPLSQSLSRRVYVHIVVQGNSPEL
eukprot:gnl/MRDRNA2_/MRDRNA2_15380_c0_seq1.p1 gnl/MRDRNA2_/MRDRNA2_15380_c0~~gnl/MRDRNA2_/MRDRNA2_15380_c0_seq1.p1  ORF type:complete len:704 (-),score=76.63 gnl/MRDRNA2_/MRDRNA2_15380_c0_seq1:399-2198(-)